MGTNYPDDICQYSWHPDSPFYDGVDVDAEWDDEPEPVYESDLYFEEGC